MLTSRLSGHREEYTLTEGHLRRKGHTLPCVVIIQLHANIMISRHPWQSSLTASRVMIIVGPLKRLRDRIDQPNFSRPVNNPSFGRH